MYRNFQSTEHHGIDDDYDDKCQKRLLSIEFMANFIGF